MTELVLLARNLPTTEQMSHQLNTVADPQHRHAEFKDRGIGMRSLARVHALRTAGEDDARDIVCAQRLRRCRVVIDFGVDLTLANPACDDLRELRSEVEDGDGLWHERQWKTTSTREPSWLGKSDSPRRWGATLRQLTNLGCAPSG